MDQALRMGGSTVTTDRPRGGRRPDEFPLARERDVVIMNLLKNNPSGLTRNQIVDHLAALGLADRPRLITYALNRLRGAGRVGHVPEGHEGHGYWTRTVKEIMNQRELEGS